VTLIAVWLATGRGDEPKATSGDRAKLAEQLDRIKLEYEAAERSFHAFFKGSTIPDQDMERALKVEPDLSATVRRIAELGTVAPKDPAVRDAMLWVIRQTLGGGDNGPNLGDFSVAGSWLVRHFGDDPDAVRVGLDLDGFPTANRDNLLLCFYASANGREAKGLARLALAQFLESKARMATEARKVLVRPTYTHDDIVAADGSLCTVKEVMPDGDYAYLLHLKQCDVDYLSAEAERLYQEVLDQYADVPYITTHQRKLEALLKQPKSRINGQPLSAERRRTIEARLAKHSTLGEIAEARLDDLRNLAVGKEAPEIRGVDVQGKPLKLSDYRGRVVALVFWGTWCGPCMPQVPREKALIERMKGRSFAMLGVDCDADIETARRVMEKQGITWPNWNDGHPGEGTIVKLYRVRGYPTIYIIDAKGKIRSKKSIGGALDQLVEELVAEQEAGH
jgi:peroxiredoxin